MMKTLFLVFSFFILVHFLQSDENKSKISLDSFSDDAFDFDEEEMEELEKDDYNPRDHIPGWNKACFKFNYWFLRKMIIPVSSTYKKTIPQKVQGKVTNFFYNLRGPVRTVNCLLQGKFKQTEKEFGRFLINTTTGIGGIFDPASQKFNIPTQREDFGQTLGKWGLGLGTYLQIPFLGPRTLRDLLALPLDNIFTLDSFIIPNNFWIKSSVNGIEIIDNSANNLETLKSIGKDAADPYTYVRDAYMQLREAQVKD